MGFRSPEHHIVVCLTTDRQPLPKQVTHGLRSVASSFSFQYTLFSIRTSSICLRLLPRHPVISILPSIFPPITYSSWQVLHKMWPIQLAILFLLYSSLIPCNICSLFTRSVQQIFSFFSSTFQNFPKCPIFSTIHIYVRNVHFTGFFLIFNSNLLASGAFSFRMLLLPWQSWVYLLNNSNLISCAPDGHLQVW